MGLAICVDQTAKFYSRKETNMFLATLDASGVNTATLAIIILVSSLVGLVGFIFAIIVYWRIFAKAGYSGALGLLMFVPIANIVMLCVLAFGEWPIYRELNYLRQMAARGPQYQPPPQQFSSSPQYPQYPQG
jgi:uncharacterized membrane protein YhaH (DUF805 family)